MKILFVNNTDLNRDKRFSFLSEDVVSTGTTFRVQSILGFESLGTSSGQIVLIGEIGGERSEILRTSSTTSPGATYKEIALKDAMQFDHPQDTKVYILDWNRAEVQWAQTTTGSKSTLFAYPLQIQPDKYETDIKDTSQTSGFYFIRFNETIGNTNSDWSDPIPYAGYDDNMVFAIKKRALDELGEVVDGKVITHEFLNQSLWEARREYHNAPGKRPFRRKYNFVAGVSLTGSYRIELPSDLERPESGDNLYGVRVGTNQNMQYYDKKEWDFDYLSRPHSTLDLPYTLGVSTSIWLANGRDFSASGAVSVEGTNISYTKVSGSQNSLTITAHGSWSASGGSDAWQNISYGLPYKFTVFADPAGSSYAYFNMPLDTAYVNQNIYLDYYRTLVGYDSDADVLDEPEYDMYVDYLKAKIKHRKERGNSDITQDSNFKLWQAKKTSSLSNEHLGANIRMRPDTESFFMPE